MEMDIIFSCCTMAAVLSQMDTLPQACTKRHFTFSVVLLPLSDLCFAEQKTVYHHVLQYKYATVIATVELRIRIVLFLSIHYFALGVLKCSLAAEEC